MLRRKKFPHPDPAAATATEREREREKERGRCGGCNQVRYEETIREGEGGAVRRRKGTGRGRCSEETIRDREETIRD